MKAIAEFERFFQQWTTYVLWCFDAPYSAPVCQPFWMWVAVGSLSLGTIGIVWLAWKYIDYRLKYRAALRAQAAREEVADEQTMEAKRWKGDDVMVASEAEPDVAEQVRKALARRKLGLDKPSL